MGLTLPAAGTLHASPALSPTAEVERGHRARQDGDLIEAMNCYLRAIESVPDFMDAHINFCGTLIALSRFADAVAHCEQILAHDPRLLAAHIHLGVARIGMDDVIGAFAAAKNALRIAETPETRMLFAQCLQNLPALPDRDDDTRAWLTKAIEVPWGRASEFARHAIAMIKADPVVGGAIARAAADWPKIAPAEELYGEAGLQALASNALLRAALENMLLADIEAERFLTAARRHLLDAALAPEADAASGFHLALAHQCFINEYAYAVSDDERQKADALRARLQSALNDDALVPALWLAALAAYGPLHAIEGSDRLLRRAWPAQVAALLIRTIREPLEEARLRESMAILTPVEDDVSRRVRQQYERNPYPRWIKTAPPGSSIDINVQLRRLFPHTGVRDIGHKGSVDVLVAGCGTGQQLVDITARIAGAHILAIDLSLTSLAYARRKTDELGLRNIEYGRADILRLKDLGRDFDVIDSSGVLHHLADPIVGWNVLISLLRPAGVMRIALYSEIARQQVVAARNFAAARGYGDSPGDIRRFRQDVLALPADDPVRTLVRYADFFSVSDCRDLVFHVQEHRFTLPQIALFLRASGLTFLGFDAGPKILGRYRARFPDDVAATDLERWHAFELAHPATFGGMYQFWVQKQR